MSVVLRLTRTGKRAKPMYRIVAIEKRLKRDSTPLEVLGTYIPSKTAPFIQLNEKSLSFWQSKGAQVSVGLQRILPK